ncbi:hypothetical protein [Shewanella woodyi]|uniref:Uncharacterized protein n=1 Tax=Shewanella woodyi (strain ATCC 51908 / MS32) TaxID=392500 RepID=B1KKD0_SHEWM|nr:hypothetical protein [Shewanella woodyi]ACA85770.1 hypothetical protein Swoo_1482 [Shewanella woodyi ATCC 51908]
MAFELDIILSGEQLLKPGAVWDALRLDADIVALTPQPVRDMYIDKKITGISGYLWAAKDQMSFALGFGNAHLSVRPDMRFNQHTDFSYAKVSICDLDELIAHRAKWLSHIFEHPGFIYAQVSNTEYKRRQMMTSIQQFEIEGIAHSHLPKKHNGFPPPIGKEIVDVANNPGRFERRQGYEAAVAAEMWLGTRFFELTNLSKQQLEESEFMVNTQGELLHLTAYDKPFDCANGEQGLIQHRLWQLLYGNDEK